MLASPSLLLNAKGQMIDNWLNGQFERASRRRLGAFSVFR